MEIVFAALLGFLIDLILGDPYWMPHPVIYIGKAITFLEKRLRLLFPKSKEGELIAGFFLIILIAGGTFAISGGILYLAGLIHPLLRFIIEVIWSWQVLALRDLKKESVNVFHKLKNDSLENARLAVARIVGRDTQELTEEGVTKAAVETVAENFSDGVIAPLLYLMIGGPALALCYKAINTMDSMVGYKNETYLYFGRAAARTDDLVNFIPARLSALLLIAVSPLAGGKYQDAWRIWRRDNNKHASPNSAQTESVVAGALGLQLAGPAYYFGEYYDKPTIGDAKRPIEPEDILKANRMNYLAGILGLILFCAARICIFVWIR
jgi:adenosylcobinamide-phosphate synthase